MAAAPEPTPTLEYRRLAVVPRLMSFGSMRVDRGEGTQRWDFVALGQGHDQAFWTAFVDSLRDVDPDMAVNIEHEDTAFGPIEGLEVAAAVLREAAGTALTNTT
jgi:sugar phosphate isomerase/epimerase